MNRVVDGLKLEEVIGTKVTQYISEEYKAEANFKIEKVFSDHSMEEYEVQAKAPFGESTWFHTKLTPIFRNDVVDEVLLISVDITKRKKTELELKSAKEAAEA